MRLSLFSGLTADQSIQKITQWWNDHDVGVRFFTNPSFLAISVKEGPSARMGAVALIAGSLVVANTTVTAKTRIFLTSQVDGGAPGFVRVSARTAGTSFTITSSNGGDTSTIAYLLVEAL